MFKVPRREPAVDTWSSTALPDTIHDFATVLQLALTTSFCLAFNVSCLNRRNEGRNEK